MTGAGAGVNAAAAMAAILTAAPVSAQSAPGQGAPGLDIRHAAARVVVIAEPRADVSVTVSHGPSRLPPLVAHREGNKIIVEGGLADGQAQCAGGPRMGPLASLFSDPGRRGVQAAVVNGIGRVDFADLPVITAHVPLDAAVGASGAVWGQVGRTRSLAFALSGCGDWMANDVAGDLSAALRGSGDLQAANAGSLHAAIAGSGDVAVQTVANGAEIAVGGSGDLRAQALRGHVSIAADGSGDVTAATVEGPVDVRISGSADVKLRSGHAPRLSVATSGSGDFVFGGEAGAVNAVTSGSGDVRIAHATGPVSQVRSGHGDLDIGR